MKKGHQPLCSTTLTAGNLGNGMRQRGLKHTEGRGWWGRTAEPEHSVFLVTESLGKEFNRVFSLAILNLTSWALSSDSKNCWEQEENNVRTNCLWSSVCNNCNPSRVLHISGKRQCSRPSRVLFKINNPTSFLIGSHVVTGYLEWSSPLV